MNKKYNNINNPYINYYLDGGLVWDKNQNIFQNLKSNYNNGVFDTALSAGSSLLGNAISGGYSSGAGNFMQGAGTLLDALPGGGIISAPLKFIGGITNRLFGSQINEQAVANFRNQNSQLQNTILDANNNQDLLSQYADTNLLSAVNKNEVGKDGLFSNKASKLTASLNRDRNYARDTYFSGVGNTINNMRQNELFGATRLAEGGNLLTNGITTINNGGTHEQNPLGGVPMGVDNQGTPNVVEQGELIANDYVYSNRLKVPAKDKAMLGIKDKDITYAKALEKLSKESKERPNDPISQRGLQDILEKLRNSQEELKYRKELERNNFITPNVFGEGGDKRNNKVFVTATNGYKFPVDTKFYSTTKGPYIMSKDRYGNLIPFISGNHGSYGYDNWNTFKIDSMALARNINPQLVKKGLEYQEQLKNLNKSLQNPFLTYTRYNQPKDLPTVTIQPRKANNTKKQKEITNLTPVTTTSKQAKKTTSKINKTVPTQRLISTDIPEFPFGNIEGISINQPNGLDSSFLYPEYSNPNIILNRINTLSNPSLQFNPTDIPNIRIESPNVPNKEYSYIEDTQQQITPIQEKATNPFYNPWTDPNNIQEEWNPLENINSSINNNNTKSNTNINSSSESNSSTKEFDLTKLRYAPVLGAAIGLSKSLFDKPDYSGVDQLLNASYQRGTYTPVSYKPIGDYMQYQPFDRNYYTNVLNANTAATRRALANQSAGNRATAMAGLLANEYNAQNRLGDLFRQADEYNLAQRQKALDFNRQTNMYNSEMGLKAAMANQQALMNLRNAQYQGITNALQMKDAIDARRGQSMSANLSNLFTSLGNIGIDAYNRKDRDMLINTDTYGTLSQKPQEWSMADWEDYKKRHRESNTNKYGGKLNKKRGGFTF